MAHANASAVARRVLVKLGRVAGAEVKAPGMLRTGASAAWRVGGTSPPRPKSVKPSAGTSSTPKPRAVAKPPSNTKYYKDVLTSLYSPQRGYRLTVAS